MTKPRKKINFFEYLREMNVKPETIYRWFEQYGPWHVHRKLNLMKSLAGEPRSRAAWLTSAIAQDYQPTTKDGVTRVHGVLVASDPITKAHKAKSKEARIPVRRAGKAIITKLRNKLKTDKLLSTG